MSGVEIAEGAYHAGGQGCRRQCGADDELCARRASLRDGIVDLPAGFAIDVFFVHIVDDADDVQVVFRVVLGIAGNDLSDCVVVGPVSLGGEKVRVGLVDDHDVLAVRAVGPGEITAAKTHTHGVQVALRDDVDERAVDIIRGCHAFWKGQAPRAILGERKIVGNADAFDAGDGADAGEDLLEDCGAFLRGEVASFVPWDAVVVCDFDGGSALRLETEVDIEDVEEAAQEQTGADEQHAGECDLGDDKDGAGALMFAALS